MENKDIKEKVVQYEDLTAAQLKELSANEFDQVLQERDNKAKEVRAKLKKSRKVAVDAKHSQTKMKNQYLTRMESLIVNKIITFKMAQYDAENNDMQSLEYISAMLAEELKTAVIAFDYLFENINFTTIESQFRLQLFNYINNLDIDEISNMSEIIPFHDRLKRLVNQSVYETVLENIDVENIEDYYKKIDGNKPEIFSLDENSIIYLESVILSLINKYKGEKHLESRDYIVNNMIEEMTLISNTFVEIFPETEQHDLMATGLLAVTEYLEAIDNGETPLKDYIIDQSKECFYLKRLKRCATKSIFLYCLSERFNSCQ